MDPYSLHVPAFLHPLRVLPGNGDLVSWSSWTRLLSAMGQVQLFPMAQGFYQTGSVARTLR